MSIKHVNGQTLSQMFIYAAVHLENNAHIVNDLNVFPVPDGDTGTNMQLTCASGIKEVKKHAETDASAVATTFATGLLMGARGNSGVILSQLFRGFAKQIEGRETLAMSDFAEAFQAGVNTAYKAVMKPVEGTMLTVAKDAANAAIKAARTDDDVVSFFETVVRAAKASLLRTKELLPALRDAGVVDSGGQGLVYMYEGFLYALKGEALPREAARFETESGPAYANDEIEFGFCTEALLRKTGDVREEKIKRDLSVYGDSLLVVVDEDYVKVHIHTETPLDVLTHLVRYGELIKIKAENMREQKRERLQNKKRNAKRTGEIGIISVAMGDGLKALLTELGADIVITGGQTMNPSIEDFMKAIAELETEDVLILPNNKNVVMAAEEAANLADKNVAVVPSKSIPEGMAALIAFDPKNTLRENQEAMTNAMQYVKTGLVTTSVRDTKIGELQINKGDVIGIAENEIVSAGTAFLPVVEKILHHLVDDDCELVTFIRGKDVNEAATEQLIEELERQFPDVEFELHHGEQPVYSYIISIE